MKCYSLWTYLLMGIFLAGCASNKSLHITSHGPKGASYVGKINQVSPALISSWLTSDQTVHSAVLTYAGEDRHWVYLRAESGTTEELSFRKSAESNDFAVSGMELSAEWR
jgi:hypothetical protein